MSDYQHLCWWKCNLQTHTQVQKAENLVYRLLVHIGVLQVLCLSDHNSKGANTSNWTMEYGWPQNKDYVLLILQMSILCIYSMLFTWGPMKDKYSFKHTNRTVASICLFDVSNNCWCLIETTQQQQKTWISKKKTWISHLPCRPCIILSWLASNLFWTHTLFCHTFVLFFVNFVLTFFSVSLSGKSYHANYLSYPSSFLSHSFRMQLLTHFF